jgi:trk system potassium uptake protein TrkA
MQILILGCGRVGSTLAKMLSGEGHDVTVMDQTSDAFRRLGTKFTGKRVVGQGTDADTLRGAGIETADVFVSVTQGDNTNIMAAQIAKIVFKVPTVLTRIYDPSRAEAYSQMGIYTICTTSIAAGLMRDVALDQPVDDVLDAVRANRQPSAATAV